MAIDSLPDREALQRRIADLERETARLRAAATGPARPDPTPRIHELSQILQAASDAIIVINPDHRIRSFNEGAERTFGYQASEVLGEPVGLLLPDDARSEHEDHLLGFENSVDRGRDKDSRSEIRGQHKDGTVFPADTSIGKVDTAQGPLLMVILRDARERHGLHEALARSERQYRALVDGATDFIYEVDLAGRILFMNRAALTTLGYRTADLADLNFLDLLIDGERAPLHEDAAASGPDETRAAAILLLRARGGRQIALEVRSWLVRDTDGRPQSARSIARDVTQERAAETAKADAERRYQRLVENSRDAVLEMDLRGRILYASPAIRRMLGYSADQTSGLTVADVMSAADIARFRELLGGDGGAPFDGSFLFRARHASGQWRWIEGSGTMIRSDDGAPQGFQAVLRDVTERTELSRQLDTVLENAPVLLATIDTDGRYLSYEDRGLRSVIQDSPNLLGESVWSLHADAPDRLAPWRRALSGERGEMEIEIDDAHYRVHYGPLRDPAGEIAGATALAIDISETRRAEAALEASQDQLRQSQKMEAIGRLAGGVAHDFNNLLMVISGYCEVLEGRLTAGSPALEELGRIQSAAESAAGLTGPLLAFSRRQTLQPSSLKLNSVITEMKPMLKRIISEEITFSVDLDDTVQSVETESHPNRISPAKSLRQRL